MTTEATQKPSPRAVRVGRLDTIGSIGEELGRLYRGMRKGTIKSADGSRMASVLQIRLIAIRDFEWEKKIAELEAALAHARDTPTPFAPKLPAPPLVVAPARATEQPSPETVQ